MKIYKYIEKSLPLLTTLDLQYVSSELLKAHNLELAVPGTYESGKPVITIQNFVAKLSVYQSKQRPRRMAIKGSNGRDYHYLLKGSVSSTFIEALTHRSSSLRS